jgi:hypothetical protein
MSVSINNNNGYSFEWKINANDFLVVHIFCKTTSNFYARWVEAIRTKTAQYSHTRGYDSSNFRAYQKQDYVKILDNLFATHENVNGDYCGPGMNTGYLKSSINKPEYICMFITENNHLHSVCTLKEKDNYLYIDAVCSTQKGHGVINYGAWRLFLLIYFASKHSGLKSIQLEAVSTPSTLDFYKRQLFKIGKKNKSGLYPAQRIITSEAGRMKKFVVAIIAARRMLKSYYSTLTESQINSLLSNLVIEDNETDKIFNDNDDGLDDGLDDSLDNFQNNNTLNAAVSRLNNNPNTIQTETAVVATAKSLVAKSVAEDAAEAAAAVQGVVAVAQEAQRTAAAAQGAEAAAQTAVEEARAGEEISEIIRVVNDDPLPIIHTIATTIHYYIFMGFNDKLNLFLLDMIGDDNQIYMFMNSLRGIITHVNNETHREIAYKYLDIAVKCLSTYETLFLDTYSRIDQSQIKSVLNPVKRNILSAKRNANFENNKKIAILKLNKMTTENAQKYRMIAFMLLKLDNPNNANIQLTEIDAKVLEVETAILTHYEDYEPKNKILDHQIRDPQNWVIPFVLYCNNNPIFGIFALLVSKIHLVSDFIIKKAEEPNFNAEEPNFNAEEPNFNAMFLEKIKTIKLSDLLLLFPSATRKNGEGGEELTDVGINSVNIFLNRDTTGFEMDTKISGELPSFYLFFLIFFNKNLDNDVFKFIHDLVLIISRIENYNELTMIRINNMLNEKSKSKSKAFIKSIFKNNNMQSLPPPQQFVSPPLPPSQQQQQAYQQQPPTAYQQQQAYQQQLPPQPPTAYQQAPPKRQLTAQQKINFIQNNTLDKKQTLLINLLNKLIETENLTEEEKEATLILISIEPIQQNLKSILSQKQLQVLKTLLDSRPPIENSLYSIIQNDLINTHKLLSGGKKNRRTKNRNRRTKNRNRRTKNKNKRTKK